MILRFDSSTVLMCHWNLSGRSGDRIPVGARFSAPIQTGSGAHPASCTMGTRSFAGVKSVRGVRVTPHPLLVPWSWKSRAIPLIPFMGRTACTEPQCLYKGALYFYFTDIFSSIKNARSSFRRCQVQRCFVLTHCGRMTQICVFNTVKLGTSASSP